MRSSEVVRRCLSLAPDRPRWVEARGLLLREGSTVIENPTHRGFVVWSEDAGLSSVVGEPEPRALALAAGRVPEVLRPCGGLRRATQLPRTWHGDWVSSRSTSYGC